MKKTAIAFVGALPVLLVAGHAMAQAPTSDHSPATTTSSSSVVAPDNTKANKEDSSNRAKTADMQKNDASDIDLAKRIRRSVLEDKGLSTYGHNVKIVAVDGTVTLNGVVRSADEKSQIEEKAASIAGKEHVVNDLKVQPPK